MKKLLHLLLCVFAVALGRPAIGQGTIIFDNFRANNIYDHSAGAGITFMLSRVAFSFTPPISGTLVSLDLPLTTEGGANAANISVRETHPTTGFPGATVEMFAER